MPTADEVADLFRAEARRRLAGYVRKIRHCLAQLDDAQLWWRPRPDMNSIANLVLHLCGNVGQWVIAGVGGAADTRDRPAEFAERGPFPKADILRRLDETAAAADAALASATTEQYLTVRQVQTSRESGLAAAFHSVAHFGGHTQEIVHMTRQQLGEAYVFEMMPPAGRQAAVLG